VNVAPRSENSGIAKLWARRKIEALMDRIVLDDSEEQLRPQVTALALEHGLLSKYTSLIAVDSARTVAGAAREVAVPNALPAGNTMFGNMPQTATPAPLYLLLGVLSLAGAWALSRPRTTAETRTGR
jgi:Ca-activated chloride channel family protein